MTRRVAVVIPARDEEATIQACLDSVLRSMRAADVHGPVVVVANRCTDGTAKLATEALAGRGLVVEDDAAQVGGLRRRGTEIALGLLPAYAREVWLLSTDADTTVPPSWVRSILGHADHGADAVAGLVTLDGWNGMHPAGRTAYHSLLTAGITGATHRHAYAANLGVSAGAYREGAAGRACRPVRSMLSCRRWRAPASGCCDAPTWSSPPASARRPGHRRPGGPARQPARGRNAPDAARDRR